MLLLAVLAALQLHYSRTDVYAESMTLAAQSREAGDYDSALRALRKAAAERETEECLLLMADCRAEGRLSWACSGPIDSCLEACLCVQVSGIRE